MGILSLLSVCLFIAVATCRVIDKMEIATESEEECGNGLVFYKDHCYLFSEDKLNWFDAISVCAQVVVSKDGRAGWLSHISDTMEKEFLHREVYLRNKDKYWIGGTDIMKHKQFVWYHWRNFDQQDLQYWGPNQPTTLGYKAHCTEFWRDGKLYDNKCEVENYFICERSL